MRSERTHCAGVLSYEIYQLFLNCETSTRASQTAVYHNDFFHTCPSEQLQKSVLEVDPVDAESLLSPIYKPRTWQIMIEVAMIIP